jgi:hypothetical protein
MGAVGAFPNLKELSRRPVRGPVNPLDKSTIISIYPKPIEFKNPTLLPGKWNIEAGTVEKPAMLVVGPSSWWKDVGPDEPLIEIVQGSVQIAESLVKDYMNGMFAVNMVDAMIGLFFIPGEISRDKLMNEYHGLLGLALKHQSNYYRSLIKYADALWARSNGNPLALNDEMRMAARSLGVQDRDWMKEHVNVGMVPCFACGEFKHPDYAICKACHSIDPNHPKAKFIQRADPFHGMEQTAKAK